MPDRTLFITIDTEVDKDATWCVSAPPTFTSVTTAVPEILSPLFGEYGATPTYLLSAEVIADPACAEVLGALGPRAELGTHLHAEFVEPQQTLTVETMAGRSADAVQCQYPPEIERAKLEALSQLFEHVFGRRATSFRAGRYGMSDSTLSHLAALGYAVDSSVTPGVRWRYPQATLDYRRWTATPTRVATAAGEIVEVPLSIRPGGAVARVTRHAPEVVRRGGRVVFGRRAREIWLRPTWQNGAELVRYVEECQDELLVLMFHNVEIMPNCSPYAASREAADRIVASLRELLAHCVAQGIAMPGLSEAAALV